MEGLFALIMKHLLLFSGLFLCFSSRAQIFHVPDTSALLVKTTSQSPAHWYIEIVSDCPVDTTLRWKATHFDNIPAEWEILMDDQTDSHFNIQPGDSADFNLPANQPFATKMIIGAMLNGTPGHGICYFDVYDPDNLSEIQTISYEFIVTPSTNGITDLNDDSFLEWKSGILKTKDNREADFEVFDLSGKQVRQERISQFKTSDLPKGAYFIVKVTLDNKRAIIKIFN